jgi:deoxyguanosine kinase
LSLYSIILIFVKAREMPRVEICGGIASGKTTFATVLSSSGFTVNLEDFTSNPFWAAFYSDPVGTAFETELTFFLQHYHAIKKKPISNVKPTVCDYSLLLDLAYARTTLSKQRLGIFSQVFQEIWREIAPPTLLIHLRCDAVLELDRIFKRGRSVEKSIDVGYLSTLNSSLDTVVDEFRSTVPVLVIDSGVVDFANDGQVQERLTKEVLSVLDFPELMG